MSTTIKTFLTQLGVVFKNLSAGRKISLLVLIGTAVLGCILMMTWASRPDYAVLYTDLEPEDAGVVIARLKEQKIPYQINANGRSVLVPKEKVREIRLELAASGLPQGGAVGFELFDQTKLGMTQFALNVNYQRAMQGELSRTINGFAEVDSSRVHLVMQPKSLFVEDENPATASVVLKLRPGKWLNRNQVDGIVHLVSSSIMGLRPEDVTVVDNFGKVLSGSKENTGIETAGTYQLEYRHKIEKNLESRISTMLEKALGPDKAIIRVSCPINFKKHEKTEEMYFPDNQVVRSEQLYVTTDDDGEKNASGIPGLGRKKEDVTAVNENGDNPPTFKKQDRTVNYEIGKVTSHIVEPYGNIERISVAVLVDGNYEAGTTKEEEENWKYIPRTSEELGKIENIVKSAITFDKDRGDQVSVVNLPFEADKLTHGDPDSMKISWMEQVMEYGRPVMKYLFALVVVFLVYLIVIRPVVRWVTAVEVSDAQLLQQLPKTVGELEREFDQGAQRLPYNDRAANLLSGNSEKIVQVLRSMVNQQ